MTNQQSNTMTKKTNHLHDKMAANGALFGSLLKAAVQIVLLTIHLAVDIIKGLATQRSATAAAHEAIGMIQVAHRLAGLLGALDTIATSVTNAKIVAGKQMRTVLHLVLDLLHHGFNFTLRFGRAFHSRRCHRIAEQGTRFGGDIVQESSGSCRRR